VDRTRIVPPADQLFLAQLKALLLVSHSPTATLNQLQHWQMKYDTQAIAEKFLFLQKWFYYK